MSSASLDRKCDDVTSPEAADLTGCRLDGGGGGGGGGDVCCLILWNWSDGRGFLRPKYVWLGDVIFFTRAFTRGPEAPLWIELTIA